MAFFQDFISYFCEYDLYNNMLSNTFKSSSVNDVLLEDCNFDFINARMESEKTKEILQVLQKKLEPSNAHHNTHLIQTYVRNEIPLSDLFANLSFAKSNFLE